MYSVGIRDKLIDTMLVVITSYSIHYTKLYDDQKDLFIPNSKSPQHAKDEFIQFKNDDLTLFEEDVKVLRMYE